MDAKTLAYTRAAVLLFAFAIVSGFSALLTGLSAGEPLQRRLDASGGLVGPITVQEDGTVLQIEVRQDPGNQSWSFVGGEVLDAGKNYLFGFGEEMWHETGYDSDGYWSETKSSYDVKIRLPRGQYYLNFSGEKQPGSNPGSVRVTVEEKLGSSIPFWILALLALLAAVLCYRRSEATPDEIMDAFSRRKNRA
jgi:hypothetical protein